MTIYGKWFVDFRKRSNLSQSQCRHILFLILASCSYSYVREGEKRRIEGLSLLVFCPNGGRCERCPFARALVRHPRTHYSVIYYYHYYDQVTIISRPRPWSRVWKVCACDSPSFSYLEWTDWADVPWTSSSEKVWSNIFTWIYDCFHITRPHRLSDWSDET